MLLKYVYVLGPTFTPDLKALAKSVKSYCATGGAVKDGEIIIQGDLRKKVMEFLESKGHQVKHVGG